MITSEKSLEIIRESAQDFGWEFCPIEKAKGRILAEDLFADRDFPPFNRVAMDGICIQYQGYEKGLRQFKIKGVQASGAPALSLESYEDCLEIMTGAMLPSSADTVIRYEDLELSEGLARLKPGAEITRGKNIHVMGSDLKKSDKILSRASILRGPQIAVAATIGKQMLKVKKWPCVSIVSTGDELVPIDKTPQPQQIRISNNYAVRAMLEELGINSLEIFHKADVEEELSSSLEDMLNNSDILILSGGVSMGKFDFVPGILKELGVEILFHKVKQKPGKPLLYGVYQGKEKKAFVFGLPGNPVSSVINCRKYIVPFIYACWGIPGGEGFPIPYEGNFSLKGDLVQFVPVKVLREKTGAFKAQLIKGNGSGDLASLALSDGFLEFIPGNNKPPLFYGWRDML